MIRILGVALFALVFSAALAHSQAKGPTRTILAIGAHAGDMELTSGAVLAHQRQLGDRVVILHLTLGEGGNPDLAPSAYAVQKREEAERAAGIIGAEVLFGPFRDGELPNDEETRRYVADVIRQVRPTHVITHWKKSIHKDHATTHAVVTDAILLASLAGVASDYPPHRGVRGIYFAENWEDAENFDPYLYVNVSDSMEAWRDAVREYEFVSGEISSFPYFEYYNSLAVVRGAEARTGHAVAFEISALGKKRVMQALQ